MRRAPVLLIAEREIRQRLRSRAFAIFTALIAVLIVGVGFLTRVLNDDSATRKTVAIVGSAPAGFEDALRQAASLWEVDLSTTTAADRAAATTALADGDADVAVLVGNGSTASELLFDSSVDPDLQGIAGSAWQVTSAAEQAGALGLTPEQVSQILSPAPLEAVVVNPEDDEDNGIGLLVGTVAAILLFISVSTFGGYVLTGVVEEKTSAVVEILLAQVKAHLLLAGKVLGIGVVALVQFTTAVAAGLVALRISGSDIPSAVWVAVPTTVLWFVAGFALYSTLFALAGSFVSRQEDAQAAAAPISLVFLAAYLVVFTVGYDPGGVAATVLSLLPPFAPLLMPLRMASGAATWWQVLVSALLLLASIYGVLRAAGSIYAATLLHRGSRVQWKAAMRLRAGT